MKSKTDRLKKLSAHGMSLEEVIRNVMSADPKPLREAEKAERKKKEKKKSNKEADGECA